MASEKKRSVAIVGAGPGGLVAARYALLYGLEPTVFEKTDSIGGVFRGLNGNQPGLAWSTLVSNISDHGMRFLEYPPKHSDQHFPYRNQSELQEYLLGYAHHFGLESHIMLEHPVTSVRYVDSTSGEKKWFVKTGGAVVKEALFDFLIVATGKRAKVVEPSYKGMSHYSGAIVHSNQFSTLNVRDTFENKHVIVIGGATSASDLTTVIARVAASVTQIIRKYAYFYRKMIPSNVCEPEKSINKRPWDLSLFTRRIRKNGVAEVKFPTEENYRRTHAMAASLCKEQFAHPAFDESKINKCGPHIAWQTEHYQDTILHNPETKNKVTPIVGDSIRDFTADGIVLESGTEVKGDVVLLCTGYKTKMDFFDKDILDLLEYDDSDYFQEFIAYKHVFRPELPTVAFVGIVAPSFWHFIELQARWAIMTFAGVVPYPDAESVREGLEDERKLRTMQPRKQFPHDDFVGYADSMATDMGVLPNFEELKQSNPELYNKLWNGPVLPQHYALFGPGSERTAAEAEREIDEVWKYMNTAV